MTQVEFQKLEQSYAASKLLLLALWVLPLFISPAVAVSFDEVYLIPKILWIYAVVLPSALLVLWRYRAAVRNLRGSLVLLTAWSGWLLLSTLLNRAGWPGWWGSPERADGVLMHLIYAVLLLAGFAWARSEAEAARSLGGTALLGGALLALTNVLQQVGLMGVPGEGAISGVWALAGGGTMGNRGYMGGVLALLLPLGLVALGQRPRWPLGWLAVVLIAWAWAGSYTRGAWLAGALGLVWVLVWARPRPDFRSWGAVLFGILLCLTTAVVRGDGRTFSLSGDFSGTGQGITDNGGRKVLWQSALYGIPQRPLLGWGTPALWRVMHERPAKELLTESRIRDWSHATRLSTPPTEAPRFVVTHTDGQREMVVLAIGKVHNEYMEYALTYGLPAALLFAALLGTAIWASRALLPGVSAGLLAYGVYLLTWPEIIRFSPVAWFMMGVALMAYGGLKSPPTASPPRTPAPIRTL